MNHRGLRRQATTRIVKRRLKAVKTTTGSEYWFKVPGKLKKRPPVCYCPTCRMSRKKQMDKKQGPWVEPPWNCEGARP